jgi:hypothetical protein
MQASAPITMPCRIEVARLNCERQAFSPRDRNEINKEEVSPRTKKNTRIDKSAGTAMFVPGATLRIKKTSDVPERIEPVSSNVMM